MNYYRGNFCQSFRYISIICYKYAQLDVYESMKVEVWTIRSTSMIHKKYELSDVWMIRSMDYQMYELLEEAYIFRSTIQKCGNGNYKSC